MRGLFGSPPRLGVPLLLSTALFTAISILHFVSEPISPASFLPVCVAVNSAYYLARYVQRGFAFNRYARDAWPVTLLFPGKVERTNYPTSALLGPAFATLFHNRILPTKSIASMRWPEDRTSMALAATYFLGLAVSAVVYLQARRVRQAEDKVMCASAHEMRCDRCGVEQAALDKPQAPPSTDVHRKVAGALSMGMVLWLVQCGTLLVLAPTTFDRLWMLIPCVALIAGHRLLFFVRAKRAPPANWPSSPLFPGSTAHKAFHTGNWAALQVSVLVLGYACFNTRASARVVVLVVQLLALAIDLAVSMWSMEMAEFEAQAICTRIGHHWKCVRWCSAT